MGWNRGGPPPPLSFERVLMMHPSIFSSLPCEEAGRLVGKAVRLLGMRI